MWASPASLLGVALTPFFRRRSWRAGVLLCEGASWPRRLGFRYRALTLGHIVLCVDAIDDATFLHELVHVQQFERLGPLLLAAYPLASLTSWLGGKGAYVDNRYEIEARATQEGRDHRGAGAGTSQGRPTTWS